MSFGFQRLIKYHLVGVWCWSWIKVQGGQGQTNIWLASLVHLPNRRKKPSHYLQFSVCIDYGAVYPNFKYHFLPKQISAVHLLYRIFERSNQFAWVSDDVSHIERL